MDVSRELPQSITIASFKQPIVYKYLPNACFHTGVKGHFVRDCPVKYPQVPKASQVQSTRVPHLAEASVQKKKNHPPQPPCKNRFQRGAENRHLPKQANRYALLATLPVWEDSEVSKSSCGASEDDEDTSSKLERQVQEFDNDMVIEMNKTVNAGSENKENVAPPSWDGSGPQHQWILRRTTKEVPHLLPPTPLRLSLEEIKRAIEALKTKKNPGQDGLPAEFFQTFKDSISPMLLMVWDESVKFQALPKEINTGIIKLLHKNGPREPLANWRPLIMLTTTYKFFAKAIALRITPVLMNWICEQKGFIKGRCIIEAVISMWEGIGLAESEGLDYCFLKVDFDKAYDRLEWSFITESLESMGFRPKLVIFVRILMGNSMVKDDILHPAQCGDDTSFSFSWSVG
ncbi:hypothetical protein L7F22_030519 [Adiantum nelumboides]|nr:hypothetical protein [Adiantum nelumboides]